MKAKANAAFDFFAETYGVKWDKPVAKLVKDREALLTFYDYPGGTLEAHPDVKSDRKHLRHRAASHEAHQKRTKGCLSRKSGLAMAFKLMMSAQKK